MNNIYRLNNQIKHYEWGSSKLLPKFLNKENPENMPFAEMWMGTHKNGPSQIISENSKDHQHYNLQEISGDLPFLFKLLAVEKPLSIQAHPNKEQAEEGFKNEESKGLSIKAPKRNYKDDNHKPEIICAITEFTMMAGFREPENIIGSLEAFLISAPQLIDIITPLIKALESGKLLNFFHTLFGFSQYQQEYLCSYIKGNEKERSNGFITDEQWNLMKNFCALYPEDPAILSPLYLNYLKLQPGQAVYIPAGILHAYLSGFGVELMTASDNVLRGGLTPKYVDINELLKILHFIPFIPQIITPPANVSWYSYHTLCNEFQLAYMSAEGESVFSGNTPAICVVTEGDLKVNNIVFKRGDSFFIPKETQQISFNGNFKLYAAFIGSKK